MDRSGREPNLTDRIGREPNLTDRSGREPHLTDRSGREPPLLLSRIWYFPHGTSPSAYQCHFHTIPVSVTFLLL